MTTKMDEILYLESDTEITQVISKIKSLPGESVLLVLPQNAQLSQSIVNLRLIKKETEKVSKNIALVTSDKNSINLASQIDIPVYKSIDADKPVSADKYDLPQIDDKLALSGYKSVANELQLAGVNVRRYDEGPADDDDNQIISKMAAKNDDNKIEKVELSDTDEMTIGEKKSTKKAMPETTNKNKKTDQKKSKRRLPLLPLSLGALAFVGIIWWLVYILPSASIFVSLESEPITKVASITIDNNIAKTDQDAGKVAGQKIESELTHEVTFEATGKKEVGTKAKGTIEVRNRLGADISLPVGTRFSSGGLIFVSTTAANVPKGSANLNPDGSATTVPGTAKVNVEALSPGEDFNIAQSQFAVTSLSASQQQYVTGISENAMTGGTSKTVTVVSEDDVKNATTKLKNEVEPKLKEKLEEQAKNLTVLAGTLEITVDNPTVSEKVGDEAESFKVSATAKGRTIGFLAGEYQETIFALARKDLPEGKELVIANSDSIETSVSDVKIAEGLIILKASLKSEVVNQVNQEELKNSLIGLSFGEAENLLKSHDGFTDAKIQLHPSYKKHLPKSPKKIDIVLVRE